MSATAAAGAGPQALDVWATLAARLGANPALHVAVCLPEQPDLPFGFEPWIDRQLAARRTTLQGLPTALVADPLGSRVVAFHPVGFPGRPSRVESTVVIVDDAWALIGSSSLSRRGMSFDGGADVVLVDQDLVDGRSPTIAAFRRALQADRLGISPVATSSGLPASGFIRLADGVEAFHQVREVLRAGGLGRIRRLTPAEPVGRPPSPGALDAVDPDGETVDLPSLLALLALAGSAAA